MWWAKLAVLHWLLIQQCIQYKFSVIKYEALSKSVPPYLDELLQCQETTLALWSADALHMFVPMACTETAKRTFNVVASNIWNSLLIDIHNTDCLSTFHNKLMTLFYSSIYDMAWASVSSFYIDITALYKFALCYVMLCFICYQFFCVILSLVSNSEVIGCKYRLQNDLYCVRWGVKLCSVQSYSPFTDNQTADCVIWFILVGFRFFSSYIYYF